MFSGDISTADVVRHPVPAFVAAVALVLNSYKQSPEVILGIRTERMPEIAPICLRISDDLTVERFLGTVADRIAEVERQRAPIAQLDAGSPRYPVVVDFAGDGTPDAVADVLVRVAAGSLTVKRADRAIAAGTGGRFADHVHAVLTTLSAGTATTVGDISPLTAEERAEILVRRNNTATEYRRDATIPALVDGRARTQPNAVAIHCDGTGITYRELVARANRLARRIIAERAGKPRPVGVCIHPGIDMVVANLAVLKTGSPYVPLDPNDAEPRLAEILRLADVDVTIVTPDTAPRLRAIGPAIDLSGPDDGADAPLPDQSRAGDPAAVLLTSGSTGVPKAVELTHRAVTRIADGQDWLPIHAVDVMAQTAHLAFDVCFYQTWGALINGARLVVLRQPTLLSPRELSTVVREERINILGVTTALFHELASRGPDVFTGVERLLVFGERLRGDALRRVLRHGPPRHVYNLYGPTENGVFSTWHDCTPADCDAVPIGRPTPNSTVYILDHRRAPVPDGVVGDIYVGGDGLSPGYRGRPDLTAERFIPHPFQAGAAVFDTGDQGRYRPNGVIEFVGRRDFQVKIRGFRVEAEDVESRLTADPGVRLAAVVPSADTGTNRHLIAFVVPDDGAGLDVHGIRDRLRKTLPAAAVPARFIEVEDLPLNAHGKVDRSRLAELAEADPAPSAPDDVEIALAAVWRDTLHMPEVGPDDDFFAVGGDSRLVMQLVHRVNTLFATDLEPAVLFEAPTIAGFAAAIRRQRAAARRFESGAAARSGDPPTDPADAPLSWPQENLWDTCVLAIGTALYNESFSITIRGTLDQDALAASLNDLLARHVALRTGITETDAGVVQRASKAHTLPLTATDLSGVPAGERTAQAELLAALQARLPFTLDHPPLIRALLIRFTPEHHELHLIAHHLVTDGTAFSRALAPDLYRLYQRRAGSAADELPAVPTDFLDYARSQRAKITEASCASGLRRAVDQLRDAHPTELPSPHARPPISSFRGARRSRALPRGGADWLTTSGRRHGTTPTTVLLAAFLVALHRFTGVTDLVTGLVQDSRSRPELDGVCGDFVNPTVLRCDLTGDPPFTDVIARTHAAHARCQALRATPLALLERSLAGSLPIPLFRIAYSVIPHERTLGPSWTARFNTLDNGTARLDLTLFADVTPDAVGLVFEYATDVVSVDVVDGLADAVVDILERAATNPDTRLSALVDTRPHGPGDAVSAAARQAVSEAWTAQLGSAPPSGSSDFFAAGGNSVGASRLIAAARRRLDIDIAHTSALTRTFLDRATVDGLAGALTALLADGAEPRSYPARRIDFEADAVLPAELDFSAPPTVPRDHPESILLTGATGFLGSHLLTELLARTDATIHCLVRAESRQQAEHRIRTSLRAYGADETGVDLGRVVAVPGDLAASRLGLIDAEYQQLAAEVDTVFHNAAWVNFIYPYEKLKGSNVDGTTRILRLAATGRPKRLHYVSTQAVFSSQGLFGVTEVDEDIRPTHPDHLFMGYVEGKWVSEAMLRQARDRGLDVSVYRPHDIGGDSTAGRWKTTDFLCALIRGCTEIGMVPDYRLPLDLTPVDITARAIVDLALHQPPTTLAWHLNNPRYSTIGDLVPVLTDAGHPVRSVPAADWIDQLRQHTDQHPDSVIAPFTHLFTERWTDRNLSVVELYLEGRMPRIDCATTWRAVTDPRIACPPGRELLPKYTAYLTNIGFLGTEGR